MFPDTRPPIVLASGNIGVACISRCKDSKTFCVPRPVDTHESHRPIVEADRLPRAIFGISERRLDAGVPGLGQHVPQPFAQRVVADAIFGGVARALID